MKKAIIFCYSVHHGNTKKIADAIHLNCGIELVMIPSEKIPNLQKYDLIGFASGIYMSSFGRPLIDLVNNLQGLNNKDCFTIYTSGSISNKLNKSFINKLKNKGANIVGTYSCRGFDTFGPFKLIGGIHKKHPNNQDIDSAVSFCQKLL